MTTERKTHILAEAADLFAARGFAAVGVGDIGARVGISGGAIYRHFENKDAVLQSLLLGTVEAWLAAATEADAMPAAERLGTLIDESLQLVRDRPGELATFMRERRRADKLTARLLVVRERELAARWRVALLARRPDLTERDDALRQRAINGVMRSLAQRPTQLAHKRFRTLVADGLMALCLAPPGRQQPATRPRSWSVPVSRRQQILDAAALLFRRQGYHGVGMDEIGTSAGISGPAVYEHFASKAEILIDLYDLAGSLVVAGNLHAMRSAASADDALTRITRSIVEINFEWTDAMIVTGQEGNSLPAKDRPRLSRRRHQVYDTWISVVRAVRPDLSPPEVLALVQAILPMVGEVALDARPTMPDVDATVDVVRAFLLGSERNTTEEQR